LSKTLVYCLNCNKQFYKSNSQLKEHPRSYCSRKCSAVVNASKNTKSYLRKLPDKLCVVCDAKISRKSTHCKTCASVASRIDLSAITVADVRKKSKNNVYEMHARIRNYAKAVYRQNNSPKLCAHCGYDKHYEVCHIKPVASFLETDLMSDINSLDNLIALCPNHHWEFDNGLLVLE
jgi:hypothetical protein